MGKENVTENVSNIKDKLEIFAQNLLDKVEQGIDFAGDQIPLYMQELLSWYATYSLIEFMIALLICFVGGYLLRGANKKIWEWQSKDENNPLFLLYVWNVFWILPAYIYLNLEWLKIWLAPRVWLLEYLARQVG